MSSVRTANADTFLRPESPVGAATESQEPWSTRYLALAFVLLILNSLSALLFIMFVNRPTFDDVYNYPDVRRYATQGVNVGTIRGHINPTGPTSFVWMAGTVRILGGN